MSRQDRTQLAASLAAVELGGGISVTAVTDGIVDHPLRLDECFPAKPAAGWTAVRQAYPALLGPGGRWRLPVHTFLVRTADATALVDTGLGVRIPLRRTPSAELGASLGS